MAEIVRVRLVGDKQLQANLTELAGLKGRTGLAKAVNRTGFEVRLAVGAEIRRGLKFAGPSTENFLTRAGAQLDRATAADLTAIIRPTTDAEPILYDQTVGASISMDDVINRRLGLKDVLAIPIGVRRGTKGRVAKNQTPGALLERYGTRPVKPRRRPTRGIFRGTASEQRRVRAIPYVFVNAARTALIEAKAGFTRVLYAFTTRAKLISRLNYLGAAEKSALVVFPVKVAEELTKAIASLSVSKTRP